MRYLMLAVCATLALVAGASADSTPDPALSAIDREIAAKGVAAEAEEFIPENWRSRVHPLRSIRLDARCVDLREINGTPAGAAEQAFVYQCRSVPSYEVGGDDVLHWVSAATLTEESATSLNAKYLIWRSQIVLRGAQPFAYFYNTRDMVLMAHDGTFATLRPPFMGLNWYRDLSPSGRTLLLMSLKEYAVIDMSSNAMTFRMPANAAYYLVREAARGSVQLVGSRLTDGCDDDSCTPVVIVMDTATGEVHDIPIPHGVGYAVPRPYGERQVVVDVRSPDNRYPYDVAIVDLDSLRIVWSGHTLDAPPAKSALCGPLEFEGDSKDLRLPLHVSLGSAGFVLQPAPRQAATRCAVTGDGRRLAVVAPPFMHFYAIGAAR